MARRKNHQSQAAKHARDSKAHAQAREAQEQRTSRSAAPSPEPIPEQGNPPLPENFPVLRGWTELPFFNVDLPLDVVHENIEQEIEELEGEMLRKSLEKGEKTAFDELMTSKGQHGANWKGFEKALKSTARIGNAPRTQRRQNQQAREKDKHDSKMRGT